MDQDIEDCLHVLPEGRISEIPIPSDASRFLLRDAYPAPPDEGTPLAPAITVVVYPAEMKAGSSLMAGNYKPQDGSARMGWRGNGVEGIIRSE